MLLDNATCITGNVIWYVFMCVCIYVDYYIGICKNLLIILDINNIKLISELALNISMIWMLNIVLILSSISSDIGPIYIVLLLTNGARVNNRGSGWSSV